MVHNVVDHAAGLPVSDLFFSTNENHITVSGRHLGMLRLLTIMPLESGRRCMAHIKAVAGMDVAERRRPLDGRWIRTRDGDDTIDLRISTIPTLYGEDFTLRLLMRNSKLLALEELGLTRKDFNQLYSLLNSPSGLILVTGSVGSGKSTTLAALVEQVNIERREHIITLEDPIEYVLEPKGCHITQREVHTHTRSFALALRGALREDPDVIMIGEMRDLETISLAITAAETGHLVLGTLHTSNASRTLDRLLDVFPPGQQEQIRIMVSESLRGVISQQLIPRSEGEGRVLALEILTNTPAVANVIREAKTFMLPGIIQTGKKQGMQLMDDALLDLSSRGLISVEEAYARADQKREMKIRLAK